jgi:hypothetical protein
MPNQDLRNLEQAKVMLDYFLETDLSKLVLPTRPASNNIAGASSSEDAAQMLSTPPPSNAVEALTAEYMTLPTARSDNIVVHAPSEVAYLKGAKDYTEVILGCVYKLRNKYICLE